VFLYVHCGVWIENILHVTECTGTSMHDNVKSGSGFGFGLGWDYIKLQRLAGCILMMIICIFFSVLSVFAIV